MLQKPVDEAHLAQGTGELCADDELEEAWAYEMRQLLLSLPYKLQQEVIMDVMNGLGSDFFRELQKKLDQDNSDHILVDIETITQEMPGSNLNPSEHRLAQKGKKGGNVAKLALQCYIIGCWTWSTIGAIQEACWW